MYTYARVYTDARDRTSAAIREEKRLTDTDAIPPRKSLLSHPFPSYLFDLSPCLFVLTGKREKDSKDFNDNER